MPIGTRISIYTITEKANLPDVFVGDKGRLRFGEGRFIIPHNFLIFFLKGKVRSFIYTLFHLFHSLPFIYLCESLLQCRHRRRRRPLQCRQARAIHCDGCKICWSNFLSNFLCHYLQSFHSILFTIYAYRLIIQHNWRRGEFLSLRPMWMLL